MHFENQFHNTTFIPRTAAEYSRFLTALLNFVKNLKTNGDDWCIGAHVETNMWGPNHMRAPAIAATEAMRNKLVIIIQRRVLIAPLGESY